MGEYTKRTAPNFRRHSDSCLNEALDSASRIPPLHGIAEEDEDFDDDWFAKLTNGSEAWTVRSAPDASATNYGLSSECIPLLTGSQLDIKGRTLKTLRVGIRKIWKRDSAVITEQDTTHKVAYLGNVLTGWAKGEACIEKPLNTLWKNYTSSSKPDVQMKLTVTRSGLKASTKDHGLTEYWSNRITYCSAPPTLPRVFCWVYRHEGRKLKQELRCHAILCAKETIARHMATTLRLRLAQALLEFKRDKLLRQNARLSLANSLYENPSLPRRKILLSTGSYNYKPPLERSKSAPRLTAIEEILEEEDPTEFCVIPEEPGKRNFYRKFCTSIENLVDTTRRITWAPEPKKPVVVEEEPPEVPKQEVEESSDEGGSSLQSISSTESEDATRELYIYKNSMERLHNYLDLLLEGDGATVLGPEDADSLSDGTQDLEGEEEVVSDESGYGELGETALKRLSLDSKAKDVPFHQIVKSCVLRPQPIESSCLEV